MQRQEAQAAMRCVFEVNSSGIVYCFHLNNCSQLPRKNMHTCTESNRTCYTYDRATRIHLRKNMRNAALKLHNDCNIIISLYAIIFPRERVCVFGYVVS